MDLGAGSCVLSDKISEFPQVKSVSAVEKFGEFFKKRAPRSKVLIESDVLKFQSDDKFDLILLFGVMNYFDTNEALEVYAKCAKLMKNDGFFLVKHQCGVSEDVFVDHFSKELNHDYHAIYRSFENEQTLLSNYFRV